MFRRRIFGSPVAMVSANSELQFRLECPHVVYAFGNLFGRIGVLEHNQER